MSITVERLDIENEFEQFSEFVKKAYSDKSFLLNKDYVRWWFASSPFRNKNEKSDILIFKFNGKIIGMNGLIAYKLSYECQDFITYWMVNTIVLPEFRRGMGVRLVSESINNFENLGTIAYNNDAWKVLNHFKFNTYNQTKMSRAIRVISDKKIPEFDFSKYYKPVPSKELNPDFKISENFTDADENLWNEVKDKYGFSTNRSLEFLNWRYVNHPVGKYLVFRYNDALAVGRIDGKDVKAMRIIDLFGKDGDISKLLENIVVYSNNNDCVYIDFYCTNSRDKKFFTEAGFDWYDEKQETIPFYLNPLETRAEYHEQTGLRIKNFNLENFNDIYFVKGDADRDRPV